MIAFAEYLLKVILCSALLTGYYWFALRNKLFHAWNRFYLLASIVVAIGLPFVKITYLQEEQQQTQPAYQVLQTITTNEVWFEGTDTAAAVKQSFFTAENVSIGLYLLVSIITLIVLLIAIIRIIRLIKKYQHWKINNLVFVDTDARGTPFSFFRFVFWNREIDFHSEQGQQIFAHELVHVKQKHSWDKFFINTVLIVFWSNPFFWIIRKELTMIHEFIADQQSVKDHDTASFAAMILATAFPGYNMPLTNPFFYSPIKRRLQMLTKLQNPKIGYISRLLLLPLLTFLVVAFAVKTKEKTSPPVTSKLNRQITVVIDAGHGLRNGVPHGAKGLNGITEDEISLAIAKKIAELNKDENLKIIFTRTDENFVENRERLKIAEEKKADLLISIHESYAPKMKKGNGYVDNPANGFEIYIAREGTARLSESRELGSAILNEMKNVMTIREPGIKQRQTGIYIIGAVPCPAVLLECGFVSNSKDLAFVTDEKNQEKIAEAVLKAIVNYAVVNEKSIHPDTNDTNIIGTGNVTTYPENSKDPISKKGVTISEDVVLKKSSKKKDTIPAYGIIFTKAEIMPSFIGGEKAWNRYIEKRISINMQELIADGKEGVCEIEFIVDTLGNVSRLTVKTMQNTKLASVLIEAIAKGPKWIPAIQNRRKVNCWATEKLTFRLPDAVTNNKIQIANAEMKILYIGVNNPLVISSGRIPSNQLLVTSSNGSISYINNEWIAKPVSLGQAVITITDTKANQKSEFIFNVKHSPDPAISIASSKGGRISAEKIKQVKQIEIEDGWEITGYMIYLTGTGFPRPMYKQVMGSGQFDKDVLELISKCGPGTMVSFDEISAKNSRTGSKVRIKTAFFNLY